MILAFDGSTAPELREVLSICPVTVILLLSLLVIGAYMNNLAFRLARVSPSEMSFDSKVSLDHFTAKVLHRKPRLHKKVYGCTKSLTIQFLRLLQPLYPF